MATTNPETIMKKEIRRLIRKFARRYKLGDEIGSLQFWDREDYKRAKGVSKKGRMMGNYPYYSRSTKAIEELAEEIYELKNTKIKKKNIGFWRSFFARETTKQIWRD